MNPDDRVVMKMPLEKLWNAQGEIDAERFSYLSKPELKQLLRNGPVQFVLADPGKKLTWLDPSKCYQYWKDEIEPHLAESERFYLEQFPGEYAYVATEWRGKHTTPIVLLEKHH